MLGQVKTKSDGKEGFFWLFFAFFLPLWDFQHFGIFI